MNSSGSDNGNPKNQTPGKKKSRRGGARPGAGRKKGAVEPQTLAIREIARSITLGNPEVVARLTREAKLGTMNHSVFINLMDRGFGRPIPMEPEKSTRQSLIFLGISPWAPEMDNMAEQTSRMLAQSEADEKLRLEAKKPPVVIDAATKEGEGELLELVVPPPELPELFRDRGR
jgi:hypothetical protein